MSAKTRRVRAIDIPLQPTPGPALPGDPINAPSEPPAQPGVDSPVDVVHSAGLTRNDQGLTGYITVDWDAPPATEPPGYVIQFAEDAGYTTGLITRPTGNATTYTLRELRQGDVRYYRVFAVFGPDWSTPVTGGPVTVPVDTTPPTAPSSVSAAFQLNGSALLTATPASDGRTRRVQFVVQPQTAAGASNGTARTLTSTTGRIEYTVAMNRADTSGGGLSPRISVSVRGESWAGVLSDPVVVSATKARPAQPVVTATFTGRDLLLDWADVAGASSYPITVDGVAYSAAVSRWTYPFDRNAQDHSGVADPAIAWTVGALDALGQTSTTDASGTATNAAPAAPTAVTLTAGAVSSIEIAVTATQPLDFTVYRYRLTKNGAAYGSFTGRSGNQLVTVTSDGTYRAYVAMVDAFGQVGPEADSGDVVVDALTIAELRSETSYTDSLGNTAATLARLKDGVTGGGAGFFVNYPFSGAWAWTEARRPQLDRVKTVTVAMVANDPVRLAVQTSSDGVTWRYFSGPLASDGRTMTEHANLTDARSNANALTVPVGQPVLRYDFPALVECRYVRVWHLSTAGYAFYELYPRRIVQADDLEAECVTALHVAAGAITADKIAATAIDGKTITGALIRTAASGQRVELDSVNGLRGFNNAGVVQVQIRASDGKLTAGGGDVELGADGIALKATGATPTTQGSVKFVDAAGTAYASVGAADAGTLRELWLLVDKAGDQDARIYIRATAGTKTATMGTNTQGTPASSLYASDGTNSNRLEVLADHTYLSGGPLRVGNTTGGADGDVRAAGRMSAGGNPIGSARMTSKGSGTTNTTASFATYNSNDVNTSRIFDDGSMSIAGALTQNSDARLKDVAEPLDDAQPIILGLLAVWYAWKDDPAKALHLGFIAQQVREVAPHLVVEDPEDGTLRLDYIGIVPYLVRLAQQQHAQLRAHEARLERLEAAHAATH